MLRVVRDDEGPSAYSGSPGTCRTLALTYLPIRMH